MRRSIWFSLLFVACAKPNYQTPVVQPGSIHFAKIGWAARWEWEKYPTDSVPGSMLVKFWPKSTNPPDFMDPGLDVSLFLWMNGMGHGSSPVHVTHAFTGVFRVDHVYFIMHGNWELHFELKRNGAVVDDAVSAVTY